MTLLATNAEVLKSLGYIHPERLAPREVDFNLVFGEDSSRERARSELLNMGFECSLVDDAVDADRPELLVRAKLIPSAEAITEIESKLEEAVAKFGGFTDGWGFFGDTVH